MLTQVNHIASSVSTPTCSSPTTFRIHFHQSVYISKPPAIYLIRGYFCGLLRLFDSLALWNNRSIELGSVVGCGHSLSLKENKANFAYKNRFAKNSRPQMIEHDQSFHDGARRKELRKILLRRLSRIHENL